MLKHIKGSLSGSSSPHDQSFFKILVLKTEPLIQRMVNAIPIRIKAVESVIVLNYGVYHV